jgi:EmrB/QacA subfamily drug resistance transporter
VINPRAQPCDEGLIRSVATTPESVACNKTWVLAATIMGSSMAFIDGSVVNVALPALEKNLQANVALIQWVINAYTLSLAALILIGGAAGDRFGRRRVFVIGIGIFAGASLWCGLAPNVAQLIAARVIQGVGAALLIPTSLAIIGASFDETERGRAIGTWAGFSAIAGAIAPLLGGWIVDHFSWRWIFLINPVFAVPTIWLALRHLPESRDPAAGTTLDWPGALLVLAGLGSLAGGLIAWPELGWRSPMVAGSLAAGLLLLIIFVWWEARSPTPLVPLDLFRSRTFTGVNLLTLLLYAALAGAFFLLPFALIQVHGYSATLAGAVFLPFTIVMGVLSRWSGGLADRFGARLPLTIGPAIAALGYAWLAATPNVSLGTSFILPMAVLGLGMAVSVAPLTTTMINAVPKHRSGVASGINNAVARVAGLLAVAIFGAIALADYTRALDARLPSLPSETRQVVERARGTFAVDRVLEGVAGEAHLVAESVTRDALAHSISHMLLLAAALALAGSLSAALTIRPSRAGTAR